MKAPSRNEQRRLSAKRGRDGPLRGRVLVTGVGPFCSLGQDGRSFWQALLDGRTCITQPTHLAGTRAPFAAEIREPRSEAILSRRERRLDRVARMAILASAEAVSDAGLKDALRSGKLDPRRVGTILGSARGAAELLEEAHRSFLVHGPQAIPPRTSPQTTGGGFSGAVSMHLGLLGPSFSVSAACSSSSVAIGLALDVIRAGRADVMVVGGAEACLTPFCVSMLDAAGVLSRSVEGRPPALRPFAADRDGTVLGEGAGIVVLESEAHAEARGARAYCELSGFGATSEAYSLTSTAPEGEGLARAMRAALDDGDVANEAIDYINAHGTGTMRGDQAETTAIKSVFGARAYSIPISSTKSMTGHLIGAAGGLEAIVCALAIAEGAIPPTIHLEKPDPDCDLDYVPRVARRQRVGAALSNSMGFGGSSVCLAFTELSARRQAL